MSAWIGAAAEWRVGDRRYVQVDGEYEVCTADELLASLNTETASEEAALHEHFVAARKPGSKSVQRRLPHGG